MFRDKFAVREAASHTVSRRLVQAILFSALLLLLLAALPSAQAQGGDSRCVHFNERATFWMPNSGFVRGSVPFFLNGNCIPPSEGTLWAGQHGMVDPWDRQAAIDKCNQHNGNSNNTVRPFGTFWTCHPSTTTTTTTGTTTKSGGSSSHSSSGGSANQPRPAFDGKRPLAGVVVAAELGTNSGIIFQRMTHHAVGIQSVIDRGVLDVVDVWGNANQYFEVCFPQAGRVVFLDAATSPRTVVEITNFTREGYTCGAMNRAGTMVLVNGAGGGTSPSAASNAALQKLIGDTSDPVSSAFELEECQVTPTYNLRLREEPWAKTLDIVPQDTTVQAIARTKSWFKVAYEKGEAVVIDAEDADSEGTTVEAVEGWVAAWLSDSEGDCDWAEEGNAATDSETPEEESSATDPPLGIAARMSPLDGNRPL